MVRFLLPVAEMATDSYAPIADYGAIGNLRAAALVSADGSIDWCCLPELDGPSIFAAILDHRRGGRFRVAPPRCRASGRRYLPDTNVLETTFVVDGARVRVTDFMPLEGDLSGRSSKPVDNAIIRLIECEGGEAELDVEWSPRFDYARVTPMIERAPGGAVARGGTRPLALGGLPDFAVRIEDDGLTVRARLRLADGERRVLVTRWGVERTRDSVHDAQLALEETVRAWRQWARSEERGHGHGLGGRWHDRVVRSGLTLKLLTHRHTGAIAAAPTTSLPEVIGGERNWDYRYNWVRDSAFTAQALTALGHGEEAREFLVWLQHVSKSADPKAFELQIMYGLHGEVAIAEVALPHLEGYRGSRPVRLGNAASVQRQLDIFGELLDAAWEFMRLGGQLDEELWSFLCEAADRATERWHEPDHGIWEVRTAPKHYTHSKVMAWVALDRALRIAQKLGPGTGQVDRWKAERDNIRDAVLTYGYDAQRGTFVQSFGSTALDASNLLIPIVEFLPVEDPRVQGTIDHTMRSLMRNGIVYRYTADDGLCGREGAFGLATFWLVDALALSGRLVEAVKLFEGIAARANPLGLFSEEFDPDTGAFLGNFPQAFTHIGLINSAVYLAHAEGRKTKAPSPSGSKQHREEVEHAT